MKKTALDILFDQIKLKADSIPINTADNRKVKGAYVDCLMLIREAKKMEKEQIGYTKEDVLKAGEMGEINHHDTKHIVSYLDEAKHYNETYGGNK
jgi:hypothetical protein